MIGYFKMVNVSGDEISRFKYATMTQAQKKRLRTLEGVRFICCCRDDIELELKISADLKLYPSKKGVGDQHHPKCPRVIDAKAEEPWTIKSERKGIYLHHSATYNTVKEYVHKLNIVTYDRLIRPELRLPDNSQGFNMKLNHTQKYIAMPSGEILYDVSLTNYRSVVNLEAGKEYFLYGLYLDDAKATPFNKDLYYIDIVDCFNRRHRFYVEKDVYLEARNLVDVEDCEMVAGVFAYKKSSTSKILTISDIYIAPISKLGILI